VEVRAAQELDRDERRQGVASGDGSRADR